MIQKWSVAASSFSAKNFEIIGEKKKKAKNNFKNVHPKPHLSMWLIVK